MAKVYPKSFFGDGLVDTKSAKLGITSSAVLYGLSVYTVFPVCLTESGKLAIFRLPEHFQRLSESAQIVGIDGFNEKWNLKNFTEVIRELIAENKIKNDVFVRASIHVDEELPGTRSRGLHTSLSMFVYEAVPILPQTGARLKTSVWRRIPDYSIPSRAKVNGAYINSVLAKQDALDSGYDDCIFLDAHGHVCELSAANIFIVKAGKLITPGTTSDLLEGINRRTILEVAAEAGIKVEQRTIDLTELYIADEVFACGTSALVAPVSEVDARKIGNGKPGPVTEKLAELHRQTLHGANKRHANWLTFVS